MLITIVSLTFVVILVKIYKCICALTEGTQISASTLFWRSVMKKNTSIAVLTYPIKHRKTFDVLSLLKTNGYDNVMVCAIPFHYTKRNILSISIDRK